MRNDTLLGKAQANLQIAEVTMKLDADDAVLNIAAYHLQQAVELALKHVLEYSSIRYPKTHAIEELLDLLPESAFDIVEVLGDSAYMFTSWEAKTRYVKGFRVVLRDVKRGLSLTRQVLSLVEQHCDAGLSNSAFSLNTDPESRPNTIKPLTL